MPRHIRIFFRQTSNFFKSQANKPYFPFLIAFLPVLLLYVHNLSELTIASLLVPLATLTVACCLLLLLSWLVLRSWPKSGLTTGLFVLILVYYGPMVKWYEHSFFNLHQYLSASKLFFPLAIVVIAGLFYILKRSHHSFTRLIPILNILFFVLMIQPLWRIGLSEYNRNVYTHPLTVYSSQVKVSQATSTLGYNPDVYYIILDRYANQQTLLEDYKYDNSAFLSLLKQQGFYIAEQSASNYPYTPLSLSSSLNMTYLQRVEKSTKPYPVLVTDIFPLLQGTQVDSVFHDLGYKVYQMGSWFPPTHSNSAADANYSQPNVAGVDNFMAIFLTSTIAAPILDHILPAALGIQGNQQHLSNFTYQINNFPAMAKLAGPKFIFVHMLMPHPPYIVDANCQPIAQKVASSRPEVDNYVQQLQCANKQALQMVNTIKQASSQKPIIIIQGDEGPYTIRYPMKDSVEFKNASDNSILERSRILNAYYFPDDATSQLYSTISPVNSFRLLFRRYFNLDYPALADKTYVPPSRPQLMSFMDVTDIIARGWNK